MTAPKLCTPAGSAVAVFSLPWVQMYESTPIPARQVMAQSLAGLNAMAWSLVGRGDHVRLRRDIPGSLVKVASK